MNLSNWFVFKFLIIIRNICFVSKKTVKLVYNEFDWTDFGSYGSYFYTRVSKPSPPYPLCHVFFPISQHRYLTSDALDILN